MSFGIKNGTPTYQKVVTKTFNEYLDNFIKIFLDDFTLYYDMVSHLQKLSRGGCGGSHRGQQPNSDSNCYYYGKHGHMAKNYYQREHDARNGKL
jgi:hypothetical protein